MSTIITRLFYYHAIYLERVAGIEPASSAWKAEVLPLNHTRLLHTTEYYNGARIPSTHCIHFLLILTALLEKMKQNYKEIVPSVRCFRRECPYCASEYEKDEVFDTNGKAVSLYSMVEGGGFEPPKLTRQIYSLIPLATRVSLPRSQWLL